MRDETHAGLLLALDTSSYSIGYALYDGEQVRAEAMWQGQRQGTATLLAEVVRALEMLGLTQDALAAVAVATGPGSFSGLRVGMGIAKGLALGLGIPIAGIPTLDATAAPFRLCPHAICAMVAAGRNRWAYAIYAPAGRDAEQNAPFAVLQPVKHGTPAEIGAALKAYTDVVLCGDLAGAVDGIRAAAPHAVVPPPGLWGRRPGALADLAWRRILHGDADDLVGLEPVYLHTQGKG